ncbi:hypothetical protein GBAR_LOCUS22641 [Geodia barretti]|uniref:Uncharacterized protein n=1 Tax=Geodia barretti TaxID=519541 RepID=A0AA35X5T5_GEOBA|nr:hypothetical protein GBAR_LOCUS22641 [Geodia barretti]
MAAGDSLVVHHRGRRYRRAHRRPEDAVKKEDLSRETGQSQSLPKPSLISETLPTELARLPRTTGDPHLFQVCEPTAVTTITLVTLLEVQASPPYWLCTECATVSS